MGRCPKSGRQLNGLRLYGQARVSYKEFNLVRPSVSSILSQASCRLCFRSVAFCAPLVVTFAGHLAAAEPHIDLIEPFLTNQVNVHFYTDANRTYTLQFLDNSKCTTNGSVACSSSQVPTGSWSN